MRALLLTGASLAIAVCIGGCATRATAPAAVVSPVATKAVPSHRVKDAVVPGKSTRADVIAALGGGLVIRFDSGYEVWVYRLENDAPGESSPGNPASRRRSLGVARGTAAEFVILFAPSGVVTKTRIRPAPQPRSDG